MLLLTWHATILRVEHAQNRLIHTPLVPARTTARDFLVVAESEARLVPAALHPNASHLVNGEALLAARQEAPFPHFETASPGPDHTFLALPEEAVAVLRSLLAGPWRHAESGETIPAAAISVQPGFILVIGPHRLDLAEARPTPGAGGVVHLPGGGTLLPLPKAKTEGGKPEGEIALVPLPVPVPADHAAGFEDAATARLDITGAHLAFLPLTGSTAARDWFYRPGATPPQAGPHICVTRLRRQLDAGLLTGPRGSACIFSADGLLHGGTAPPTKLPPGVSREADLLFVANAALASAPVLEGPHILATAAPADLVATVAQLCLLARAAPSDARLLLPTLAVGGAARDTWLALAGVGARPQTLLRPTHLVRAAELYWAEAAGLDDLPPAALQTVRDRVQLALPAGEPERLYITEGLANAVLVRIAAGKQGFTVIDPSLMSTSELIRRFRQAAFIVAPSAPVLDNLLFCAAGTRVIELAPDTGWQPRTATLAGKLGLAHAVLPCKLEDGLPRVELPALAKLLRLMQARL